MIWSWGDDTTIVDFNKILTANKRCGQLKLSASLFLPNLLGWDYLNLKFAMWVEPSVRVSLN